MHSKKVGCLIDLDGVVWHGGVPFDCAHKAFQLLEEHKIPYIFVTNATHSPAALADKLNKLLDLSIKDEQVVVAPSPCINLKHFHDKHVLLCCQDDAYDLVNELGFKNYTTVEQIIEMFPDLDYVDHKKRKTKYTQDELDQLQKAFKPIEVILLLGEPVQWEGALQIILDVLMTNGDPRFDPKSSEKFSTIPCPHLPVIACCKDLTFKGAAQLPRFGHGAFLECLEHLYEHVTKHEFKYDQLLGKPYIATYKYATAAIEKLYDGMKFDKLYCIGDNPEVDIKGANFFNYFVKSKKGKEYFKDHQPEIESVLVCTGVYNPATKLSEELERLEIENLTKLHIDIDGKLPKNLPAKYQNSDPMLTKPNFILNDILDAVLHIIKKH